ncbi:MAG: TetR/AcrR family transcriptional regulator [Lachnospiraceae bacterium]|nr:TetR/AcrR family transcriptional regulator [Lachnospiraceae bacterium]MBP5414980.1 TetR/AcrR family transcriptional regulator [Lachnospiraceae bacterium]
MGKAEENKLKKRESLLDTAFKLFTEKGIHNTSISDIVEQAGVAKGTFYLYFKDKYDINNKLVVHRASKLFDDALEHMRESVVIGYRDRILFVINDIIDSLTEDKVLLMFISKNLGLGFSRYAMESTAVNEESSIKEASESLLKDIGDEIKNPRLMMYMIIELTGSSIYSSILYDQPVKIDELKPYLYKAINSIIDQFETE